ncbi:MAG: L,D-transpeptidase family protein [Methylococcaceae bacterium]
MKTLHFFAISALLLLSESSSATVYNLPANSRDNVVAEYPNEIAVTRPQQSETLLDVARRFSLGQTEIVRLNQSLDRWLIKPNEVITLPNKRILPDSPRNGITLNIAEYRMYYYPQNSSKIYSFAHGVGRQDWKTPLGKTSVQKKVKDPVWRPPESIRREHAAQGDPLPEVVPAGIHNPLGAYALYLNLPGDYRIHGTDIDKIYGIGMQITHGCVRMYPEDIDQLYHMVDVGTPVYIVKQPIKVGWLNNVLYVESHPDLEGEETTLEERTATGVTLIQKMSNVQFSDIDQSALHDALEKQTGNPTAIYERVLTEEEIQAQPIVPPVPKMQPVSKSLVKATVSAAGKKAAELKKTLPIKLADKSKILPAKKVVNVKKIIETKTPKVSAYIPTHKPSPTGYFRGF